MSAHIETCRAVGGDFRAHGVASRFAAGFKAFFASLTRRKAVADLGRLDDRMLSDLGITRADLAEASRWSLWGDGTERLRQITEERQASRGASDKA